MKNPFFYLVYLLLLLNLSGYSQSRESDSDNYAENRLKSAEARVDTGKIEALVILIEFADRTSKFTPEEVDNFFNQVGFNKYHDNGSVHDYWYEVSQHRINVHTNVTTRYYKAPKTFAYYDTESGGHTHELLDSALNWLDKQGFDFSKLTVDDNKNIKALSFQFVGNSGAKGLWGHSSGHVRSFDGVKTSSYQISELGTTEMHLGGICHEQGHMLFGWPDTYDIDSNNGGSSGCGKFDLMAAGNSDNTGAPSGNPMPPNPYFRYLAGWNDMISLNEIPNSTIIKLVSNIPNTWVYRNPGRPGEMYIIEARKKPFRNVDMPGEGVLVWHIDSLIPNNANQQHTENLHYKVSVVQADNAFHLESGKNSGDASDYFKTGGINTLSYLNTRWWNSAFSGLQLRNIGPVGDTISVNFGTWNPNDASVTSSKSNGGSVDPFGLRHFTENTNQTVSANPEKGFEVFDCIVDNDSKGPITDYTFSGISGAHTIKYLFAHQAVVLKDVSNGVNYEYYEGTWSSVPDFQSLTAKKSGTLNSISLSIPGRVNDNFGIRFTGFINVPSDGEYSFYLTSDDGSKFSIDGVEIVANQVQPETSGTMILKAGYHPVALDFFEGQVTESLSIKWSGPGITKRNLFTSRGTVDISSAVQELNDKQLDASISANSQDFSFKCPGFDQISVEVFNLTGILIEKQLLKLNHGVAQLPNSNIKNGVYLIRLTNGNKIIVQQKVCILR